jgi:hypothetical protein
MPRMRRIWLERNARTFEGQSTALEQLVQLTNEELRMWNLAHAGRRRGLVGTREE